MLPFDRLTRALIPFQHYLFYVILSLARFNLYRLSYAHLIGTIISPKKRNSFPWYWWLEMVGLCVFYYWYTAVLRGIPDWSTRIAYVLITNIVPSPLHVQVSYQPHLFLCLANTILARTFPLLQTNRRSRTRGVICCKAAAYHGRCNMPPIPCLPSRRASPPSHTPPLPTSTSSQSHGG